MKKLKYKIFNVSFDEKLAERVHEVSDRLALSPSEIVRRATTVGLCEFHDMRLPCSPAAEQTAR